MLPRPTAEPRVAASTPKPELKPSRAEAGEEDMEARASAPTDAECIVRTTVRVSGKEEDCRHKRAQAVCGKDGNLWW